MRKKVVIVTRRMIMGGIEKALISMLKSIPKDHYDVTVLVMSKGGELEDEIPDYVKIDCLYGYEKTTFEKIKNNIKKGRFLKVLKIVWYTLLAKKTKNVFKQEWYHTKMISKLKTEFDIAIAYHVPASLPVVFVMNNIKAKSKIAWIHADVSRFTNALIPYKKFYDEYDKIFCVSKYAKKKFNDLYPNLKEKTSVFYNILDKAQIEILAEEEGGFKDQFNGIRILTVGRLTQEKGHEIIPLVLNRLKEGGDNVKWYCIGDGGCRQQLEMMIKKYNLENDLILLGTKRNPYPYFKQCDLYVQPSRHEGYCISIAEARAFNKPIVSTNTVGAREQIENGENGYLVNFDEVQIYSAINILIKRNTIREKFENKLKKTNAESMYEINRLFDGAG